MLPVSVAAQAPTPPDEVPHDQFFVEVADREGDLQTRDQEAVDGPAFMDLTSFSVRVDGEDLLVTLEVAGDLDDVLSTSLSPDCVLWVMVPGTDSFGWFHVMPEEDWEISRQLDIWGRESFDTAHAVGSRIEFRVPRPTWVAPEKLRFSAFMAAMPPLGADLPDVRSFADREIADRETLPVTPDAEPTDTPVVELPWFMLYDQLPDSASAATAWLSFDGEVTQHEDRGPAGTAWVAVSDHYEWFRRVAEARKERETDPVLPLLDDCLRQAEEAGTVELAERIGSLLRFIHRFDHAVDAVVRADAAALEHLFAVIDGLDDTTTAGLLDTLAEVPTDELARAVTALSRMSPRLLRRVISLVADPRIARLVR